MGLKAIETTQLLSHAICPAVTMLEPDDCCHTPCTGHTEQKQPQGLRLPLSIPSPSYIPECPAQGFLSQGYYSSPNPGLVWTFKKQNNCIFEQWAVNNYPFTAPHTTSLPAPHQSQHDNLKSSPMATSPLFIFINFLPRSQQPCPHHPNLS